MAAYSRISRRPGPLRWVWYALSGRLPMSYREWVLHDLTCPTWPLRHLARLLVVLAPVAAILIAVLPGPLVIRGEGVVLGSFVGLSLTFVFLEDATDRRATRFGYPSGTPQAVREQRARQKRAKQQQQLYGYEHPTDPDQHNGHRGGLQQRKTEPFRPGTPRDGKE